MPQTIRKLFPPAAFVALIGAIFWATSLGTLPPAEFTFNNGTEIKSLDPAQVTGSPEGRIVRALFEGLYSPDAKTLEPRPAMALTADPKEILTEQGKIYTFPLRRDAVWSDGKPVTAEDFRWSWQRLLHPETGSQYHFVLSAYVVNAAKYNAGIVDPGDQVEIELPNRPRLQQLFPRGKMLHGKLLEIERPDASGVSEIQTGNEKSESKREWIYTVQVDGVKRRFSQHPPPGQAVEKCLHLLLNFNQVGIRVLEPYRLQVELKSPTPYFLYLMQFYVTVPVNRTCIERFGYPDWIRPENIVVNGPFQIDFRRLRDRIRLKKNDRYWNASAVQLQTVDALAVESSSTGLNMYLVGDVDWLPSPPSEVIPHLEGRRDYHSISSLSIYFYRLNVTRKPFDNPLVRMALSRAIDRKRICKAILRAGQEPAYSLVPPVLLHYPAAQSPQYNLKAARRLLAQAGYPGGRGLRSIEILFNTSDGHRKIAEAIQQDWQRLGVDVRLRNLEWQTYLSTTRKMEYDVARAGWIGDYPDPNTFLDLFVTGGVQNETGWGNRAFDQLIDQATQEADPDKRMQILHQAEEIIMGELPVLPIYFYVSTNLVKPYVRGFFSNSQDLHPLTSISIDKVEQKKDRSRRDGT